MRARNVYNNVLMLKAKIDAMKAPTLWKIGAKVANGFNAEVLISNVM